MGSFSLIIFISMGIVATVHGKIYEPGQPSVQPRPNPKRGQDNRIVNGVEARPGSFPWIVRLETDTDMCGGALVPVGSAQQSDIILTAGHCFDNKPSNIKVTLGGHDLTKPPATQQIINATKYVLHPDYLNVANPTNNITRPINDVAIIKLNTPVKFTDTIQSIRLPAASDIVPDDTVLTAAGWGALHEGGNQFSVLQQVGLPKMSDANCKKAYPILFKEKEMFCAGREDEATCQGDSGGPVFFNTTKGYTVVGIVSWAVGCARKDLPDVYTRVTTYIPWINEQIKSLSAVK